jgi:hypothetical protein
MTLEGAQARVIVDGKVSTPFGIRIGVRQGDGLLATLFNLVLHEALENLQQNNTILNRLTQICRYADDILVIAGSLSALEALCTELRREAGRVGLAVSPNKTKYMRFSASPSQGSVKGVTIDGVTYEGVAEFTYLGTLISNDSSVEKEIQKRILERSRTYFAAISLFRSRLLSRTNKILLYKTLIRPVGVIWSRSMDSNKKR